MNPIRRAGVVAFIHWLTKTHDEIRSIRDTTEDDFLSLAKEFEASKGLKIDKTHQVYRKWASTYHVFQRAKSDNAALRQLR